MSINPLREQLLDGSAHKPASIVPAQPVVINKGGLTSAEAEEYISRYGPNELPTVEISLWWVFLRQFMGTMPYMLELACVISLIVEDILDFAIILIMLLCNGFLGFYEEMKAAASLRELTDRMEQKIGVVRDGKAEFLNTRFLVPGDVILLTGGCAVPADVDHIEGDVLEVDTSSVTGEPIPRKYPGDHGIHIYAGCTIRAGEAYALVKKTGLNTLVGSANEDIMKDKQEVKKSVFEEKVLQVVKVIILVSLVDVLIIFLQQGIGYHEFKHSKINDLLLTCLSIIIASIPIALPLVIQVTMALGAGKMAKKYAAVVTSLPALQDISSMTVLCSDKTGTLTTAKIDISAEDVFANTGFTKEDVALYAGLASNRDKLEDAIDRSVIKHFDVVFGGSDKAMALSSAYTKVRGVGFNPIYKRVLFEFSHPKHGRVTIVKGLVSKILDTADGGVDEAADQWKVENLEAIRENVKKIDYDFAKDGYKTLGVALKINDGPFKFVGILPMLDPPRIDSAETIKNLVNAGINVKMITGDHLNIAITTARKIGMGVNIHSGEATRVGSHDRDELILNADGFAQVLPKDKREVVLVLKKTFEKVVGMTGDGVNDAPALSAAQCGIAVDDATDAAQKAAAIILRSPGLSAIYHGVVESRRIFRKLKSYVTYRFGATIQIVAVLTILILASNCSINSLFVIILALFNDITMLPIAYDNQQASAKPENPDVTKLLLMAGCFGAMETFFSMIFAYGASETDLFSSDLDVSGCGTSFQGSMWLQIFIAAELLIFSARAPTYMWYSIRPSNSLFCSVMAGNIIATIMANSSSTFGKIPGKDIVLIWVYDFLCVIIIDILKVQLLLFLGEETAVLPDKEDLPVLKPSDRFSVDLENNQQIDALVSAVDRGRQSYSKSRMSEWISKSETSNTSRSSQQKAMSIASRISNGSHRHSGRYSVSITLPASTVNTNQSNLLRGSISSSIQIKPNTPANKKLF
jgi:H+-transporting ATPase